MIKKQLSIFLLFLTCSVAFAQTTNTTLIPISTSVQTATTVNSNDINSQYYTGGDILIYVSAYTSGTYTPHIQGKDPASGQYYDILVGTAINSAGMNVLHVCRDCLAIPNVSAQAILPYTWRVQLVGASSPSMLISVGANLVK